MDRHEVVVRIDCKVVLERYIFNRSRKRWWKENIIDSWRFFSFITYECNFSILQWVIVLFSEGINKVIIYYKFLKEERMFVVTVKWQIKVPTKNNILGFVMKDAWLYEVTVILKALAKVFQAYICSCNVNQWVVI